MSVRPSIYVRPYVTYGRSYGRRPTYGRKNGRDGTSTMKHNAATNQIMVFVKVDETFTTMTFNVIRGQSQGQEMTSVPSLDVEMTS